MKHRLPLFVGEVIFYEIPTRRYAPISKVINNGLETLLGIKYGKEGIKVFAFDVS